MIYTIFYFILLFFITIFSFSKKCNNLGKMLLVLYTSVAAIATYAISANIIQLKSINFFPYIYLVLCYLIFFSPFLTKYNKLSVSKLKYRIDNKIMIFAIIYLVCTIITIYVYFPYVLENISSNNWAANRLALYSNGLKQVFSNKVEYYSILFVDYFQILALIVGFLFIKENKILGYTLIIGEALTVICSSIYTSSRGTLVDLFVLLIAFYFFFYEGLEKKSRKFIYVISSLGLGAIFPYVVAVTVSRFSSSNAGNAIILYLGQAPIVFNAGVFNIFKYSWGSFGFGNLFGLTSFTEANVGGTWNSGFFTFVGWFYIDWGIIGVLILGIILSIIFKYIINKRNYKLSDIFLIFSYYQFFLKGVFVIGRSYCFTILATLLIYVFLKIVVDNKKYIIREGK